MTMICKVQSDDVQGTKVNAYIGDELVGVAQPLTLQGESEEAYYFLTIQSDAVGTLRFETEDGQALVIEPSSLQGEELCSIERPVDGRRTSGGRLIYASNAHHGSLKAPIILIPGDNRPYKIIENNHVIIIRNNEKYDITGKKL
jgi:hypothetical protein